MLLNSSYAKLFSHLQQGGIVITPNNRLSRYISSVYYQHQTTSTTCGVIDRPSCLAYETFLHQQFTYLLHRSPEITHPHILTTHQEYYLWQNILNRQPDSVSYAGTIHAIQDAWARCQQWRVEPQHADFSITPQTQRFFHVQQQFQTQLNQLQAITAAELGHYIAKYAKFLKPSTLMWVCFDDFSPQQRALQNSLQEAGWEQLFFEHEPIEQMSAQYAAPDTQIEYSQLLAWLQKRLKAGDQRIGVIVPALHTEAKILQRLLQRHLSSELFNISLGKSLIDFPLVAHALLWLQLEPPTLSNTHARLLLQSPYLCGAKHEFIARSQLMQTASFLREMNFPIQIFIKECRATAPLLANLLKQLSPYPEQATPANWVNYFKDRLQIFGFPGDTALNSMSFQCLQRLMRLLEEFQQLNRMTASMSAIEALQTLQHMATSTVFQIKTPSTPIQILGLLEASGCEFDSVWVTGLTDQCLPQKTAPSPFIPLALQRQLDMPHANPTRELQFAQQLLTRIRCTSQQTIFSYPCLVSDAPHLPSPLIRDFPDYQPVPYQSIEENRALVPYHENYRIPYPITDTLQGGTSALSYQAECPFRSFAAHRLHARPLQEISVGPDPRERGQVLHKIMENLWQRLETQQGLKAMQPSELQALLAESMTTALNQMAEQRPYSFPPLIQSIEISRLNRLIHACLEWEKERQPFVIEALEKDCAISLAGMNFRVRIDRLDRILMGAEENHPQWVIDYKTSIPSTKPWLEDRPEASQLLLYALLDANIKALLFLQLKGGRVTCCGISEDEYSIRGITPLKEGEDWSAYQAKWHRQLTLLAEEIIQGYCAPEPTRASTCTTCEYQNLCRYEVG